MDIKRILKAAPKKHPDDVIQQLSTLWGEELARACGIAGAGAPTAACAPDGTSAEAPTEAYAVADVCVLDEHPRPQFARERVQVLNGWWDYAFAADAHARDQWGYAQPPEQFDGKILVPFSPEAPLSGVERQLQPDELLWYRTEFPAQNLAEAEQCLLHFDAVDYACAVYCNGNRLGVHKGGYLPFRFDVTDYVREGACEVAVCVYDPSEAGAQLRGKQTLERGNIWYTAQSGIWKTVWLEVVPEAHVAALKVNADPDRSVVELAMQLVGHADAVEASLVDAQGTCVASVTVEVGGEGDAACEAKIELSVDEPHLWTCDDPYLYGVRLKYGADEVESYCAFRTVEVGRCEDGKVRFLLNHEPVPVRGVLDQGYWPDGLMTPPSDDALVFDILQMKRCGFNMLRKHIKVESERWYYHCDRLGMLVWQDMVSGGGTYDAWFTSRIPTLVKASWTHMADDNPKRYARLSADDDSYRSEWIATCKETIDYLGNHPSIACWVLFNEGWGQFDAKRATELAQAADPTRVIDAASGWYDQQCGDFFSVHNYFRTLEVFADPMGADAGRAFALSEFGGLTFHVDGHSALDRAYGYADYETMDEWRDAVIDVLARAEACEADGQAVHVYTQLSDVEEETNGILTYDRKLNKLTGESFGTQV